MNDSNCETTTAHEGSANQKRKALIRTHADHMAAKRMWWKQRNRYFYDKELAYFQFIVPQGARILDLGCGPGDLLVALKPSLGVGVDLSEAVVEKARQAFSHLHFVAGDIEDSEVIEALPHGPFDYIILSDTIGSLEDCQRVFQSLAGVCHRDTRVVVCYYNFLWEWILRTAELFGLRMPQGPQNFLSPADISNLMEISGFDVVNQQRRILLPKRLFGLGEIFNRYLAPLPIVNRLCLRNFTVARSVEHAPYAELSASVVIPCRNERGNIEPALQRMPRFADDLQIVFVEGHSQDGTPEEIERVKKLYAKEFDIVSLTQPGIGKGDAMRAGFAAATRDVLLILDADLTVPPEDLPKFFDAIASGRANFVNGSRLVYPLEKEAMRFLNLMANSLFAKIFTWLLGQRITDTLCGTKVLTKAHYQRIEAGRDYFGEFDPFGDFDMLFGATKANLKIVEIPIRYRGRAYGETQISRFRHGWLLVKMVVYAFRKMKAI